MQFLEQTAADFLQGQRPLAGDAVDLTPAAA
jgi:hypothetical protein